MQRDPDATHTADANWTVREAIWSSGPLSFELTGLPDGVGYDVQVHTVNANGDGPWSSTSTDATTDHGSTPTTATTLALNSSIAGRIDPHDDQDVFKTELTT